MDKSALGLIELPEGESDGVWMYRRIFYAAKDVSLSDGSEKYKIVDSSLKK